MQKQGRENSRWQRDRGHNRSHRFDFEQGEGGAPEFFDEEYPRDRSNRMDYREQHMSGSFDEGWNHPNGNRNWNDERGRYRNWPEHRVGSTYGQEQNMWGGYGEAFGRQTQGRDNSNFYGPQWQGDNQVWDKGRQSFAGRGPKNWSRSDERIKDDINEQLTQHHMIDASEIEVEVKNGEITLKGTVSDKQSKRMAEDLAESVSGSKQVHNQLRVESTDMSTSERSMRTRGTSSTKENMNQREGSRH